MTTVRLAERAIDVPVGIALPALGEILKAIERHEAPWGEFALHVSLGEAGLPDVGSIAIPINLEVATPIPGINQYRVTIRAARHPEAFPTFDGSIGVDMHDTTAAVLWLGGTYVLPLGALGEIVDASLAQGVAQRCLENLLDDLATETVARVRRRG